MKAFMLFLVNFALSQKFVIDSPGCRIRNHFMPIPDVTQNFSCGERKIDVLQIANNKIVFHFTKALNRCCFQYIYNPIFNGSMNEEKVEYSSCWSIVNGSEIRPLHDFIRVRCHRYKDVYGVITKIDKLSYKKKGSWNVIVLGLDRTSRMRAHYSINDTIKYLVENGWLDFRGYNKIGHNTFPNLAYVLTGKSRNELDKACSPDMTACNHLMLWSKFKEAGYVTAYGEDHLTLPDTLHRNNYFKLKPTDHYMRPLFTASERSINGTMCSENIPSGRQMLSYILHFVETYQKHNMFGFFWINSFGHDIDQSLLNFDSILKLFFRKLSHLEDTFLVFFSDHGLRYGVAKENVESFYEDRLPMLFIKAPKNFRKAHPELYLNLRNNQGRLISPIDLHLTLRNVLGIRKSPTRFPKVSYYPKCSSMLLPISKHRTCADIGIPIEYCACHELKPTSFKEYDAMYSLMQLVTRVQNYTENIKTRRRCEKCAPLNLHKVIRMHYFTYKTDKYFVIAFNMFPSLVGFEGIVHKDINYNYRIISPINAITFWKHTGDCAVVPYEQPFCACKKFSCKKKPQKKLKKHNNITKNQII